MINERIFQNPNIGWRRRCPVGQLMAKPCHLSLGIASGLLLRRGETEPHREAVLEAARISGFEIIDIDAFFRSRPDPLDLFPFNQDGVHYTQEGNALIAEEVIRAIESHTR